LAAALDLRAALCSWPLLVEDCAGGVGTSSSLGRASTAASPLRAWPRTRHRYIGTVPVTGATGRLMCREAVTRIEDLSSTSSKCVASHQVTCRPNPTQPNPTRPTQPNPFLPVHQHHPRCNRSHPDFCSPPSCLLNLQCCPIRAGPPSKRTGFLLSRVLHTWSRWWSSIHGDMR
jgi:hypothetical protein